MVVDYYKLLFQNKLYWCTESDSRIAYALWGVVQKSLSSDRREGKRFVGLFCRATDAAWESLWLQRMVCFEPRLVIRDGEVADWKGPNIIPEKGLISCSDSVGKIQRQQCPTRKIQLSFHLFIAHNWVWEERVWVIVSLKTKNWATEVTDSPYT